MYLVKISYSGYSSIQIYNMYTTISGYVSYHKFLAYYISLQKQVGRFYHRVVTMVADKLGYETFHFCIEDLLHKATSEVAAQFILQPQTILRTSVKETSKCSKELS